MIKVIMIVKIMIKRFGSSTFKDGRCEIHITIVACDVISMVRLSDFRKKETSALKSCQICRNHAHPGRTF